MGRDESNRCDVCKSQSVYTVSIDFFELDVCDKMGCAKKVQKVLDIYALGEFNEKRETKRRRV